MGADQPGEICRQLWRDGIGRRAVHAAVVLVLLAEADADQYAQGVRVRRQRLPGLGEEEDLVRSGLADPGKTL